MVIVKFTQPPLTEVVFGIEFDAPNFSSVHFGLYWETIREKFPIQIDRTPVQGNTRVSSIPPLRRVWFQSDDRQRLIQLEDSYFAYNWNHGNKETYPHFDTIFSEFLKEWNHLKEWWSKNEEFSIEPIEYQLTYLNLIDEDSGWSSTEDYSKVFTLINEDFKNYLTTPRYLDFQLAFHLPNDAGKLTVDIEQILEDRDDPDDSDFVTFTLKANSFDTDREPTDWFESAHDYVVKVFLNLTQKEAQEKWGRYE